MIITSKKELSFYLKADMMMNRGYFKKSIIRYLYELWVPDQVMKYLISMRKYAFYSHKTTSSRCAISFLYIPILLYYKRRFILLGNRLGFSIGEECLGYGAVIHHPGTIVIGDSNRIGNYALINTSTCIVKSGCVIGNGFFMGSGAVITKQLNMGNNVWIGANSIVNKSCPEGGVLLAGTPAVKVKDVKGSWYNGLYRNQWKQRYENVENMKKEMQV